MDFGNKFPFELNLQRTIIKMMIRNETFFYKCYTHLREEYFENQYLSWLFRTIVTYHKTYNALPSEDTIKNEILKFEVRERIAYEKVFEDVLATEYKDLEYLYHELTGFAKRAHFVDNIKRIVGIYNEGNRSNAYKVLGDFSKTLLNIDFEQNDLFDYSTMMPLLETLRQPKFRIPLGIKPFDEAMNGGIPRGRFLLFLAGVSQGKSMVLTNIARNFIEKGKKVLFITLENPEDEQIVRFLSPMTDIPQDKFSTEDLSPDEKVSVIQAKEKMEKFLFFRSWYKGNLTIDDVDAYCRIRFAMNPYDAIIIDYVQMIKQKASQSMAKDIWIIQGDVVQRLEALARELKVPIISAAQVNRAGMMKTRTSKGTKDLMRMTDVGESYNQVKLVDMVVTMTVSDDDFKNGVMRLLLDKHRGGQRGILVECGVDFKRQKIFSPDLKCRKLEWEESRKSGTDEVDDDDFLDPDFAPAEAKDDSKSEEELSEIFQ